MIHKKVKFKDEIYWLHTTWYGFNLSPLEHYSESGELLANGFSDTSYAIAKPDGSIYRHGKVIGTVKDLIDV